MNLQTISLFDCVLNQDINGVKMALSQNANVNENCCMDIVVKNDGTQKLCEDSAAEVDVDEENQGDERTPLHYAVFNQNVEIVNLLIAAKADVNDFDIYGMSPLHYAAMPKNYSPEMMQILLDAGADVDGSDEEGYTPIDYLKISVENGLEKASVYLELMESKGKKNYV